MTTTRIEENGLNIELYSHFLSEYEAADIYNEVIDYRFKSLTFTYGGRKISPLRRIYAFSDDGALEYAFSGNNVRSKPWSPVLKELKSRIEAEYKQTFNFCLLNYYPNGEAYISPHKDDETCHVPGSAIITVSVGATRTINFTRAGFQPVALELTNGSALIMYPPTNIQWFHGIKKTPHSDVRVSLTFRLMDTHCNTSKENDDDDDSLISEEYAKLAKNNFYNAQSDQLDYERSRISHLADRRKEAKRRKLEDIFNEDAEQELLKRMRAIYEVDLDYTIIKVPLSDTLYLSCVQFKGELKVHLREYYKDAQDIYKPSKNGIVCTLETWYEIYLKMNNFCLKYAQTSFVANNAVAFLSFNNSLVIKSLYRNDHTLILNDEQYDNFNNCIVNFTNTTVQYIIGEYLRKNIEKYIRIEDNPTQTDSQLIQILIACIEGNLSEHCSKRYICEGCLCNSLSQYKHLCQTLTKREIFQTFDSIIYLTLNCQDIVKQFKSQVGSVSKTFLCLINYEYIMSKIFDEA